MNLQEATQLEDGIDQALACGDLASAEELAQRYRTASADHPGASASHPRFRAAWLAAQVALAAGRLTEAARRASLLLPLPTDVPDGLACRVWLLLAETLARQGKGDLARRHLDRALAYPGARAGNPRLSMRSLRIRLLLGEVESVQDELGRCATALEGEGDLANVALLLSDQGRAWDERGDLERAELCWRRAERLAALGPADVRADVLVQLGRLDHLHGRFQSALDRYESALACAPAPAQMIEVLLREALVLLDLAQEQQARLLWQHALGSARAEDLPEEIQPLARMVAALLSGSPQESSGERAGYALTRTGELRRALEQYQSALANTRGEVRRARLALGVGMLALACGEVEEARRWLDETVRLARAQDLGEVLWRALQAQGQLAAEVDGEEDRALALFEQAVLLAEAQSRSLRSATDAARHRLHRAEVLRRLLRAACRRGDPTGMFRLQELDRGRLLLELWRSAGTRPSFAESSELADLDQQIGACERALHEGGSADLEAAQARLDQLLLQRDRLFDRHLRDRGRQDVAALPALPDLAELTGSAEVAPLMGREVFGLVTGLLAGGVRAVLAGLWPVADREAVPFMWRFYRERLTTDLAAALARTQRAALAHPDSSPLFWGAFALTGDPKALPAPGPLTSWLARWRQRRHARRFPVPFDP